MVANGTLPNSYKAKALICTIPLMLPLVVSRMPPSSFAVKTPYCANLTLLPLVATCLRPKSFLVCANESHCMNTSFLISLAICTTSLLTSFMVMMPLCTDPLLASLVANSIVHQFCCPHLLPKSLMVPKPLPTHLLPSLLVPFNCFCVMASPILGTRLMNIRAHESYCMNTGFLEATAFAIYLLLPALAVILQCGRCADSTGGATILVNP
ncbi:unnamed protein product, partial [Prorocentrum cordatum]